MDQDPAIEGDAGTEAAVQQGDAQQDAGGAPATAVPQAEPAKVFDIFEFVKNIKCPPLQKAVISEFDESAANNPHQILRSIFTFLRTAGVSEADKILVLNMGHELLFAYFDEHVDPIGEAEQQMALEALKMVYVDEATSEEVRRELNNVVSLIWKLSEEIDIEQSPNQVANLGQLLRYCLNPATHTAATTQADRHLLAELGLTLFARIMHEILLPYLLSHEEGEDDEDGPAHFVEKALFPHLSSTITDATAPLSLRIAAMMVITNAFNSELPSCLNGFLGLNTFLPQIVRAISELSNAGDYEKLEELLRSFDHLSLPFVVPHIPIYVQTLVSLATSPFVPGRLRSVALQPLISLSTKHAVVLGKEGNFLRFLVWHLMYLFLLAEPRKEEVEEQDESFDGIVYEDDSAEDEDEHHGKDSPTAVAGWALSAVVRAFGYKTIMPVCMSYIGQFFMCEEEWQYPHAALRALAALMKAYGPVATPTRLDPLVYTVVHYFQHPNISLRVAAAVCLGRMAKYVPQFSKKFSALVMPVFNDRLKDSSVSVLITTCRAMTYFFQNKSRSEGVAPRNDDFEDEHDDAKVDAEDEEEPEVDQYLMPPPEAQLDETEVEADSSQQESEVVPPAAGSVSPPPSSPEEDQWSDRLVQGLTELVKEGSAKVKEHAVTALFNITQLSDTVLKKHLPRLVALCLGMLDRKVAFDQDEKTNLRTIGRVFRCTTQVGTLAGKEEFQADALKFINALISPNDTIERLLDVTPSYVASALGRIALCLQMDFAPYIGLFINVTERCIPHECDAVLLMTEDRPVDMDGWEVAETVDDFGGVQKVYVYKRDIRDKRIAINALGSVITMFAESDEGAQHFLPYIKPAQYMLQRVLRLVDNNFEVMGVKELSFCRRIPSFIRLYERAKSAQNKQTDEAKLAALKATLDASARAARALLPGKPNDDGVDDLAALLHQLVQQPPHEARQAEETTTDGEEKEKGKEKQLAVNDEADKKEGNDDEFAEPDAVTLLNLVEPLWQDLANAWERVQEPKKSMELFVLWEEILSTAKGECLGVEEVHATAEHLLSVLYDSDHYMDFEGEEIGEGASFLAGSLIPEVMEGLLQYHPKAFDGPFLMNHVIPSLQNVLQDTPFPATQQGCLLMLDSVLDYMPQPADYVSTICPLLFRFVLHPDPAISQAACYGLGVCAKLTSPETDKETSDALCQGFATLQQATIKWHARAQRSREDTGDSKTPEQWVCDNTLSAQAKVFCKHYYNMPNLTGAIDAWLEYLPLRADTLEMVEVLEILCGFIRSENPHVRIFITSRRMTVARALVVQLRKFNRMVKVADHIERLVPLLPFINQYIQQTLG